MNRNWKLLILATLLVLASGDASYGQESDADRVSVAFSDPSRPGLIRAHLIHGGITVIGYEGAEVVIEASVRYSERKRGRESSSSSGMRRLAVGSTGLVVEEENNVMSVRADSHNHTVDLKLRVPFRTSLKLNVINDGHIRVERVTGEIEVSNTNGKVTLQDISGRAVAHALNQDVIVNFLEVTPDKAMSFSSMNGKIDVTYPATVRANVTLRSDMGEVYSDFDIKLDSSVRPVVEDSRSQGGKYRVRIEKSIQGTLNGGGPLFQFKNFNGDIYIRKGGQ